MDFKYSTKYIQKVIFSFVGVVATLQAIGKIKNQNFDLIFPSVL